MKQKLLRISPTQTTRIQCRAVHVALVLETVDASGEVIRETVTQPQKVLRPFWATLPQTITQIVAELNATPKKG
jgi:hypothetical protein